jgi:hypothetical protein
VWYEDVEIIDVAMLAGDWVLMTLKLSVVLVVACLLKLDLDARYWI